MLLANDYCDHDIALFTGKNADIAQDNLTMQAFKDQTFSDITQLDRYKFVISTSCLTSGVDINSKHFTLCIGVLTSNTFSPQTAT